MTRIAILPEPSDQGVVGYRAIAGMTQSTGKTVGAALDALTKELPEDESGTLVIVQHGRPDRFFTAAQRERLEELMAKWRAARDAGAAFSDRDQKELDALVETEVRAASDRASALASEMAR